MFVLTIILTLLALGVAALSFLLPAPQRSTTRYIAAGIQALALLLEIEKRQAGISALVAFMDEREAKRNPQPAKPTKPTGPALQTLRGSV